MVINDELNDVPSASVFAIFNRYKHCLMQNFGYLVCFKEMSPASSINGFSLIPVLYTPSTTHYICARPHSSSKAESNSVLPSGRTPLFLVNIPPDATERELILLFKHCGILVTKLALTHYQKPDLFSTVQAHYR